MSADETRTGAKADQHDEEKDEVEAHMRHGANAEAGDEAEGDDDVEAHGRTDSPKSL